MFVSCCFGWRSSCSFLQKWLYNYTFFSCCFAIPVRWVISLWSNRVVCMRWTVCMRFLFWSDKQAHTHRRSVNTLQHINAILQCITGDTIWGGTLATISIGVCNPGLESVYSCGQSKSAFFPISFLQLQNASECSSYCRIGYLELFSRDLHEPISNFLFFLSSKIWLSPSKLLLKSRKNSQMLPFKYLNMIPKIKREFHEPIIHK